jgi:tetratricopeptide (TPR) repeat protein
LAIHAYQEALRIDPDFRDAHYNLANVYYDFGRYADAIHHYQEALRLSPDFANARIGLEQAMDQLDRPWDL